MNSTDALTYSPKETDMTSTLTHAAEPKSAEVDRDLDTVACPTCGETAVVTWRTTIGSTDGPMEHLKIHCPAGHWFFMPAYLLA